MRERIQARETNAAQETLTPFEACVVNEVELINAAHTDPEVRGMRLSNMRGGDKSRRPPVAAAGEVDRTEAEGGGGGSRDISASCTHCAQQLRLGRGEVTLAL